MNVFSSKNKLVSNTFKYKFSATVYDRTIHMTIDIFFPRFMLFFFFYPADRRQLVAIFALKKKKRIITFPVKGVKIDQLFFKKKSIVFQQTL